MVEVAERSRSTEVALSRFFRAPFEHKSYKKIYGALPHALVTFYLDAKGNPKHHPDQSGIYIFESKLRHLSSTQPKPCRPHASATRGWLAQANASQTPCLILKNL
jgi:hypothetical protein